jgi:hypothetical protein
MFLTGNHITHLRGLQIGVNLCINWWLLHWKYNFLRLLVMSWVITQVVQTNLLNIFKQAKKNQHGVIRDTFIIDLF